MAHNDWTRSIEVERLQEDDEIVRAVREESGVDLTRALREDDVARVRDALFRAAEAHVPDNPAKVDAIVREILGQMTGYGPLEPLFKGPGAEDITEIQISPQREGPPKIYIVRFGNEEPYPEALFPHSAVLQDWVRKTVDDLGVTWTEQNPISDFWMPDGSRVNAIGLGVSPFGNEHTAVTIRKSPIMVRPVPVEVMLDNGTLTEDMAQFIEFGVINGRRNMVVVGATDSGKSALLRSFGTFIDPHDHTAIVETSFELYLPHLQNAVNLVEVHKSGKTVVSAADIARALLRQNIRRALFGEIRSAEIVPAFTIMQSIAGGCHTTVHAEDRYVLAYRVQTAFGEAGRQISIAEAEQALRVTFQVVIFVGKDRTGQRRIMDIYELSPEQEDYRPLWTLDRSTFKHEAVGKVSRRFMDAVTFAGGDVPKVVQP